MMTSLSNKYDRLKKILEELGFDEYLPHPEQDPSLPRRKRKTIELESETYISSHHCNRVMPEVVKLVNNLVNEQPGHWLFFIDAFRDKAFQGVSDVHKVETETLLGYKVIASNVKTDANLRLSMLMSEMINKRPYQEKILSHWMNSHSVSYLQVLNLSLRRKTQAFSEAALSE
ncbi:hypothetical protein Tco_0913292 [Tanacetum coccineum]